MADLEKNTNNQIHEQTVFERIIKIDYNKYSSKPLKLIRNGYWSRVDGSYPNEEVRTLDVLTNKGWRIVNVTKAFFTYEEDDDKVTYGIETALLEK